MIPWGGGKRIIALRRDVDVRFPPSPSVSLVFNALAGQEAFVEVVFDGAHFCDQVGEVREGQQAAAGQYELCGVGFHRDQLPV